MKLEFLDRFSKNIKISIFMKIRPVGACRSMRISGQRGGQGDEKTDRRTWRNK